MVNRFRIDDGVLVRDKCRVDWESWKDVLEEIRTIMINELEPDWDIDKSDTNMMKFINIMFKYRFRELKFDVELEAELQEVFRPSVED
ncbi:hypothetical protein D8674_024676 [Pyrus ussuriensis x Pyrus communis]|uniref:Uncharacterized protein n=1 Tax=Pyrus ussuriensis x Pyrus communis TaxID=2448454 RepID=A0A5N5HH37_9ROSA|nr:hypothetical protein D8674_024676 [Pyrus ussuriensis x Pyrus communis]